MKKDILKEAAKIIRGDRRKAYGPVGESFGRHAMVWTGILLPKLKAPISREEVILMMIGLKVMREANTRKSDNRVDLIGYTLLLDNLLGNEPLPSRNRTRVRKTKVRPVGRIQAK